MQQKDTRKKLELLPFQTNVLKRVEKFNRVAFYLDMGLGKTFVGSEKLVSFTTLRNLVICQHSKIGDWIEHFEFYYPEYEVIDLTKIHKDKIIHEINRCDRRTIYVINYDLINRRNAIADIKNFTLLLDESSVIQNTSAKWTKFILSLNPSNVILLSGTPCSGKYENLWSQALLLGWNITEDLYLKSYVNFVTKKIGNRYFKTINKRRPYKNVERLKRKLAEHGAVFMKSDEVINLPEQNFIDAHVPAPRNYKKFIKNKIVQLDDGTELIGNTPLTLRLYSRMMCGLSKEKFERFSDMLDSTSDRVIVYYNFNCELDLLKSTCELHDRPVSVINGDEKNLDAYENEENSVTLVQYQSGAMGLNLQKSNRVVYYSLPERSELFEQSKKRINRIGQNRACFYHILLCKGTVEESIYATLKQRKDYTDELFRKEIERELA